ncbi:uncharacterized protein LOC118197513 [Stegodyphus dumicola]|uniref:uncharacterized protein LOC118197513 n=1 Tax=Stegodyphus dumicola TaxID=202533 RepID=UPI0015AA2898|nr:uncharacterized protein LOC118197513 [Stegodyphus dumicola]
MPLDSESASTSKLEASKVSVKILPFWVEKPEMWFFTVEAQFKISGITSEDTRFNYLVAQLEPKFIENIWDIIRDDTPNKYSAAKERLLSNFKESEKKKKSIKRLLTGLELGDLKPSQLLRKMRALGDADDVSDKVLRTLWMEKLPDQVKNILIVSDEGTDKLATMADKILEMNPRIELASVVQEAGPYDMLLKKFLHLSNKLRL